MKSVVSWLKKKAKCLIGKEKKKCYKLALGLVAKDNSKIIGEIGDKVSSKDIVPCTSQEIVAKEEEGYEWNPKKKKRWGKRKRKDVEKKFTYTLQEETGCNAQLMEVHEPNPRKRKGKGKPSQIVVFVEIHEKNVSRGGEEDAGGKVLSEEQICTSQEMASQKVDIHENVKDAEDKVQSNEQGSNMQEIAKNRNALLVEIHEQSLKGEGSVDYGVPSEEQTCASQGKSSQNMEAHLLKICEQYMGTGRKGKEVGTRKEMLLADPLTYGSSLLSELPSTPAVETRPPSRSGVGFSVSSGTYRPESRCTWNGLSRLSPIEEDDHQGAVGKCSPGELACKLQEKMERVTWNRTAHLVGICEQNRDRERRREEVRWRKKMLHFKPAADGSASLLGDLPPISYAETSAPPGAGLGLTIESCDRRKESWKETLDVMSEQSVTETSEETGLALSGGWVKNERAPTTAAEVKERLERSCDGELSISLCFPSAEEAPDKDPPRHRCGGVSAKGDEDPSNAGMSSQNGVGKLMEDCVAGGEPDHIQSDECSADDTVSSPEGDDDEFDFEEMGMEHWDDENVPEFDFCIYCPMHSGNNRSDEYCPLHNTKGGKATLDNSGSDGSGEDDEGRLGSDSTQGGDSSDASSLADKPKLGRRKRKSISFNHIVEVEFYDKDEIGPRVTPSGTATSLSKSSLKSSVTKSRPKRELPDKWVDTCILPVMTNREVLYDRKDADLFYRRKYFIYKKDRMRSPSYHLELDGIVKNTEEHRRLKRRIFKAEEGEDVLEFKEITRLHLEEEKGRIKEEIVKKEVMKQIEEEEKARVKDEEEKKLKRMLDKVELTKRWYEMNKNNAELWKQEQKRNERKWREILMKDDGKRQELEAQWQEVELKFDEERDQVSVTGPKPPALHGPPDGTNPSSSGTESDSSSAVAGGSRNSFRRRLYRRRAADAVANTTRYVSTEVSADAKERLKMPPILGPVKPAPRKFLDLGGFNHAEKTDFFLPPLSKLPITCQGPPSSKSINQHTALKLQGVGKARNFVLPPLTNLPITCQPPSHENDSRPQPQDLIETPKYYYPKRSERYLCRDKKMQEP